MKAIIRIYLGIFSFDMLWIFRPPYSGHRRTDFKLRFRWHEVCVQWSENSSDLSFQWHSGSLASRQGWIYAKIYCTTRLFQVLVEIRCFIWKIELKIFYVAAFYFFVVIKAQRKCGRNYSILNYFKILIKW